MESLNEQETHIVTDWPDEEPDIQRPSVVIEGRLYKPGMFLPGQSGNPKGRKPGPSMKEYAREMLRRMTKEERYDFMAGLPKETIWRMAEGNPSEDKNITITVPKPILGGMTQEQLPPSDVPTNP